MVPMLLGLLLVALAAVSWGTTGTTLELVGAGSAAVPLVVGAMRAVVAAPLLAGGARLTRTRTRIRPRRPAFLAAGLCMAAYQVCFFSAVPLAGVAATALLAICSAPVLVTLLARLLLGEPLSRGRAAAMALGVAGAALLVGGAPSDAGPHFVLGCGLALGAGLANSLYAVVTKGALAGGTPLGLSAQTFAVAAVALLPVLEPATTVATVVRGWPLLLYLGAVPTAAAYCLYTTGLRRVPAGAAAVAGLLEPMTATVLGLLLFGERLGAPQAAGAALLLAGVCLTAAATARTAPAP
ncbi:MAG TPA: EamA family transporter [Candidatus Dormibacteraeota bacterium]|jgi:DME family drug/metabolite transporter|nr:EamA family transporter [Candidatus Dormibacteraeota bacterium]